MTDAQKAMHQRLIELLKREETRNEVDRLDRLKIVAHIIGIMIAHSGDSGRTPQQLFDVVMSNIATGSREAMEASKPAGIILQ